MNKYTFYGDGIFRNKRFSVEAKNKKEAIEKAKKELAPFGITVSTMKKAK